MDTVADMLTTLVNAQRVGKKRVAVPYSRFKKELLDALQKKQYIANVRVQESPKAKLVVTLAYDEAGEPRISGIKRLSKPGSRMYVKGKRMPYSYKSYGSVIVSTSQGLKDEREVRQEGIGGELVCAIW